MDHAKVKAGFRYWRGDSQVERVHSVAVVITHYEINGHWAWAEHVRFISEGPFLFVDIPEELPEDASPTSRAEHAELLASFDEDSWIEDPGPGTGWFRYHVGDFELVEIDVGEPALS